MAFTFTVNAGGPTVFGNQRVQQGVLTCDGVSGVCSFGFATISHISWAPKSMTTNGSGSMPRFRINSPAAAGTSAGDLGVSGVVSGDEVYLTVYGH